MAIAHNLAVDRLRREHGATRPHLVFVEKMPDREQETGIGAAMEAVIDRDVAARAMESLSESERTLLSLAYFQGMTAREIADADGIPLGTVKTRLRAALIKLRRSGTKEPQ